MLYYKSAKQNQIITGSSACVFTQVKAHAFLWYALSYYLWISFVDETICFVFLCSSCHTRIFDENERGITWK